MNIKNILNNSDNFIDKFISVKGWVKSFRSKRFISINDGSTINNLQIVILDSNKFDKELIKNITVSCSLIIEGIVKNSQGDKQKIEVVADNIKILGNSKNEDIKGTILQPKKHSLEILRDQSHLRFRTNLFGCIFRVRSKIMYAIHEYFNRNDFIYINTPIITSTDAEGAGEMFRVTTLNELNIKNNLDYSSDFFCKDTFLTVSGQLQAEAAAMGLGKVYTFGPTFRAENSNTSRHLSEFWMIEPEVAFNNLNDNIDLAEDFIKNVIKYILNKCEEDILFLNNKYRIDNDLKNNYLIDRLENIVNSSFIKISYTEAINILMKSGISFQYNINNWGEDLQSEHERFLVEKYFNNPLVIYNYPRAIKAFYMKDNSDGQTVKAMDILFPGIGEIIGGSQREENYEILYNKMLEKKMNIKELQWYLDTRKFGTVEHSGFGLGLERFVSYITGMSNVRDTIPYPRTPKNAKF